MSKSALTEIKVKIASLLREFGNELYRENVIENDEPFKAAAEQCKSGTVPRISGRKIDYAKCWGYSLDNVVFKIQNRKKELDIKPTQAKITSIVMQTLVVGNIIDPTSLSDPLHHLEFNIIINAKNKKGTPLTTCWHLDRDLEGDNEPEDLHPIYHFTYGGKNLKLDAGEFQYGSNIVLDTPRFAHLPLEGILGVDFVLSNYFGLTRRRLCNETPFYSKYLKQLQEMLWRPYAFASTLVWPGFSPQSQNWSASKIWPQLIEEKQDMTIVDKKPRQKSKKGRK